MPLDIDQSYYNTGTATVAANGLTVTGQGTLWRQSVRANDMYGTHVGMPTRIAQVVSDTQLTLAYPWKGPAQTAAPYEIQFTPYDVGYQQATRALLQKLASGNVEALAGLVGAPNMIPYFTGPGAMGLIDGANLEALAELTGEADKVPYFTGTGTMGLIDLSALTGVVGTFNPTPTFSNPGDLSVSYNTRNGRFTKVGRLLAVEIELSFTPTFTTASGPLLIGGLPFAAAFPNGVAGNIAQMQGPWSWPSNRTMIGVGLNSAGNSVVLRGLGSGASGALFEAGNLTSGQTHSVFLSVQYQSA